MTPAKLKHLCMQLIEAGKLPGFVAHGRLLVRVPVADYLLRCVYLDSVAGTDSLVEATAVYLPLYFEQPGFSLSYSRTILKGAAMDEYEKIAEAINTEGIQYLDQATNALEFARATLQLNEASAGCNTPEDSAWSFVQGDCVPHARIRPASAP